MGLAEVELIYLAGGGVAALAGLALLAWSLVADRPRGRRRCPRCWYDMTGSPQRTCSECGHTARRERSLHRIRRRWWCAAAAVVLIAGGYEIWVTPRIRATWRAYGWRSTIPTTLLLAAWPWLDEPLSDDLAFRCVATGVSWDWQRAWYARFMESRYRQAAGAYRGPALQNLGVLGPSARRFLPVFYSAARDADASVRNSAAYSLGMVLRDPDASLPLLADLVGDEDEQVRSNAAWALWRFAFELRGKAANVAPALAARLEDPSEPVRLHAAMALSLVTGDPAPGVAAARHALAGTTPGLDCSAVVLLGMLDPAMEGIVPLLCTAAGHPDARIRFLAVSYLMNARDRAASAVPTLIERLNDRELNIHLQAVRALGEIGPAAAQAAPELERLSHDPDPSTSDAAKEVLEKVRRAR